MSKVPVLVTGGAGYIGSHAMLALKDAGWSVSVIDDLSNGVRRAVPEDVPFYEGNVADRALVHDADGRTPYDTAIWFESPQIAEQLQPIPHTGRAPGITRE